MFNSNLFDLKFFIDGRPHKTRSIRIGEICCLGTASGCEKIMATGQIVSPMVQQVGLG